MVKNCDFGLENAVLGQDLDHSFSPYGPPSRQITYMYCKQNLKIMSTTIPTFSKFPTKNFQRCH